jgi:SpoVK/Ycf46/Vps4 family AAA+-type ATPase
MYDEVTSKTEIEHLIRAGYPLIMVLSPEETRVERAIEAIARVEEGSRARRQLLKWSITEGFITDSGEGFNDIKDPLRCLEFIHKYEAHAIFVVRDFHPFLQDPTIVRKLRDLARGLYKDYKRHIILLSPVYKPVPELEKEMAVIDFSLPTREEINHIVTDVLSRVGARRDQLKVITEPGWRERVVEAALGLTADEARNVFAKSLVSKKDFDIETILGEKKHIIRKSGILEFYESKDEFDDVGGLETLKEWLHKRQLAFTQQARDYGLPVPKGILMIGVPGCGKSLTAKAVSALWKMPLLRLDVGKVFSSLVGSSEENIRKCIRTAEAVAPCILWLDELEKGFSGTKSSGQTDGGTTARVFASFITWLQEKQSSVFVIATANDVTMLPPELLRKGRFDEIFFVDLPSPAERTEILSIHLKKKKRNPANFDLTAVTAAMQGFAGSEVEQVVISALYDAFDAHADIDTTRLVQSATEIIPLSVTMKEGIDGMREWAKTRARRASLYDSSAKEGTDATHLEM